MACERDVYLSLASEVEENRKNLFARVVDLVEVSHLKDLFELAGVAVAEVVQQAVALVGDDRRCHTAQKVVFDRQSAVQNGVADERLPDVVAERKHVFDEDCFVTALVALAVVEDSDVVLGHKTDWHLGMVRVPVAVLLRYSDVAAHVVAIMQNLLVDESQVVQVLNLRCLMVLATNAIVQFEKYSLRAKGDRNDVPRNLNVRNCLLKVDLEVDALAGESLVLSEVAARREEGLEVVAFVLVSLEHNCLCVRGRQDLF